MAKSSKRTSDALKDLMWDQMEALLAGETTPQHARAMSSLAGQVCGITRLEMDFSRFVSDARADGGTLGQIPMGMIESK